jgi:hypothetical protein
MSVCVRERGAWMGWVASFETVIEREREREREAAGTVVRGRNSRERERERPSFEAVIAGDGVVLLDAR